MHKQSSCHQLSHGVPYLRITFCCVPLASFRALSVPFCANANTSYANALHCVRTYVFESVLKAVAVGALRPGMWRRSRSYVQGPPPRQHATVRTYVRTCARAFSDAQR